MNDQASVKAARMEKRMMMKMIMVRSDERVEWAVWEKRTV